MSKVRYWILPPLAAAVCMAIVYGFMVFVMWEADPSQWDMGARVVAAFFGFIALLIGIAVGAAMVISD